MYDLDDFTRGDRVELHPATDLWMRGARFGHVAGVGRIYLTVVLDQGFTVRVPPRDICNIVALSRTRDAEWHEGDAP